jgi:protein ImuA
MIGTTSIDAAHPVERPASDMHGAFPALEQGYLHEIHSTGEDKASALAFALTQLQRDGAGAIFLIRAPRRQRLSMVICGDGLIDLGIDPGRLTIVEARNDVDMLRAGLEAARCPGVAAVVMESEGRFADYDLTASRRLVLASEATRVCIVMLRTDAEPRSSGAQTRWIIQSRPSVALEADAPGLPALEAQLLRCRSGSAGRRWLLSWDGEHGCFSDADWRTAVPGAVVPFSRLRTDARDDGTDQRRVA